jgi:hypothetical protein
LLSHQDRTSVKPNFNLKVLVKTLTSPAKCDILDKLNRINQIKTHLRGRKIMNHKEHTTNRWKMSALVMGLSALVLLTLAAPGGVAAADIALLASDSELVGAPCSDAVSEIELDRNYGTFAGCWVEYVDQASVADPNVVALDRNYGTFTSVWTDR